MSPTAALESPIFRFYAGTAFLLLAAAGAVLAILRWGLKKNVDHAWRSCRGWLVMIPLIVLTIFLGRAATITALTLIAIFSAKEFARASGLYRDWFMTGIVYLGIIAVGIVSLMQDPVLAVAGWYGLFMALPVYVIAAILLVPIVRNRPEGQLQTLALAILAFVYFGWMFGHLAYLANSKHAYSYLMYVLFAVELNDVSAYVFGKLWGRHPLRGNISPKKTWEGSLGALAVSLTLPWLLRFNFPQLVGPELPLTLVLIGLIVGIGGQLGDLAISVIKRDLGVKDMGAAIPGHGGLLDRIDSLIYVAPLYFHVIRWLHDV